MASAPLRVAAFGNCQLDGVIKSICLLNSGIEANWAFTTAESVARLELDQVDKVVAQHHPLIIEKMKGRPNDLILYPRFFFGAYHPDCVYVSAGDKWVQSPLGDYNSAIACYGFRNGLSEAETTALFNARSYARLGYDDQWDIDRANLATECRVIGYDLGTSLDRWAAEGPFMFTVNHPKLRVLVDIGRTIVAKLGLEPLAVRPELYLDDWLSHRATWPIYPEIARRMNVESDGYWFKAPTVGQASTRLLSLDEFVAQSFAVYARHGRDALSCKALDKPGFRDFAPTGGGDAKPAGNPYKGLPAYQFWRSAVAERAQGELDPVVGHAFTIKRDMHVATAGSCFAQHIARNLQHGGFGYYVAEQPPEELSDDEARRLNYGVFSARYANIYTARQLSQLLDRAFGRFDPVDVSWQRSDGRIVDPFRPMIEPDGFVDEAAMLADRERHFAAVRYMAETLDVFVFTLGLTEAWQSMVDGAVFPVAPGVVSDSSGGTYGFVNFRASDVAADLDRALQQLWAVNPRARVILTVSPVPLVATYENAHCLVSTTYSKAALRVAAEEVSRRWPNVVYFPSYEIITGAHARGRYFAEDLREVTPEGVAHVMTVFQEHFLHDADPVASANASTAKPMTPATEYADRSHFDIVCEEELIAR